jgi:phage terminase small subunit
MALTIKQEKFCMVYIETGNASEAYRQSYNTSNMKPESITNKAYELLKNGDITARLNELKGKHAKRHEITVDTLLAELEENRQAALGAETVQASAATAATMGKAKLLGLLIDKQEHTGANGSALLKTAKDLTEEELKDELKKYGID